MGEQGKPSVQAMGTTFDQFTNLDSRTGGLSKSPRRGNPLIGDDPARKCADRPRGGGGASPSFTSAARRSPSQYFPLDQGIADKMLTALESIAAPPVVESQSLNTLPHAITKQIDRIGDSLKFNILNFL